MERRAVTFQTAQHAQGAHLPFGIDFQGMLLKVLLDDSLFARNILQHIEPYYFQNEAMSWAWGFALRYREKYGALPTMALVLDQTRMLNPAQQPIYAAVIDSVRSSPVVDEQWLRDETLDFVKRQIFRKAMVDARDLFNADKVDASYDLMMTELNRMGAVTWESVDRQWYMEEFSDRHVQRIHTTQMGGDKIGTGIPELDAVLEGGAYPGFLGDFLAQPKAGKTTTLVNFGAVAVRAFMKNVLHIPLEGSGKQIASRYDAVFLDELYGNVKRGDVDAQKYAAAMGEMRMLQKRLVIRSFTEGWEYNITHIWEEMRELKRQHGWEPALIIVDYCDLLHGREKRYPSSTEEQKASFQDLKTLANRGFAVWTASQVQRPRDADFAHEQTILRSRDIADCYAKVRIADFIGSLNQTVEERKQKIMRMYCELYRDNEADKLIYVNSDFQKMRVWGSMPAPSTMTPVTQQKAWGYEQATNKV